MSIIFTLFELYFAYQYVTLSLSTAKMLFLYLSPRMRKILFLLISKGLVGLRQAIATPMIDDAKSFTKIDSYLSGGSKIYNLSDIHVASPTETIPGPIPDTLRVSAIPRPLPPYEPESGDDVL